MTFTTILLLLAGVILARGQAPQEGTVVVPTEYCVWRGGDYGVITTCHTNEVVFGSCGSGRDPDCHNDDSGDREYDMLQCCPLPDTYTYDEANCTDIYGDEGVDLSCVSSPTAVEAINLEGVCGSGRNEDCDGYYHMIRCCTGSFDTGELLYSAGSCIWSYEDYGELLSCQANTQAVFGRCGSSNSADCDGGDNYHGILCCSLISLLPV